MIEEHPGDDAATGVTEGDLAPDDIAHRPQRYPFGSDAPNTPCTFSESLRRVRALALPPVVEAAVLAGNAERLVASGQTN